VRIERRHLQLDEMPAPEREAHGVGRSIEARPRRKTQQGLEPEQMPVAQRHDGLEVGSKLGPALE
jgi:hypothetical protein